MLGRHNLPRLLAAILAFFSLIVVPNSAFAAPLQAGPSLQIPWWVWLVVISLFLLITFIVFIMLSWRQSADSTSDDDERR